MSGKEIEGLMCSATACLAILIFVYFWCKSEW